VICATVAAVFAAAANSPTWPQTPGTDADPNVDPGAPMSGDMSADMSADTSADKGRAEFLANCAGCHGADAKGSGPKSAALKVKPADLTILAKRNNGLFAAGAIYRLIDGRQGRSSHISADMPIWGCRHLDQPARPPASPSGARRHGSRLAARKKPHAPGLEALLDLPCDSETAIQNRILSIVGYLSLIQQR
jgi:mono/diheme cytochrome c family protein